MAEAEAEAEAAGTPGGSRRATGWRALADETAKFGLVGGLGVFVNFAAFDLCRAVTQLNVLACGVVGTAVAIVSNYLGFRYFTYRDRDKQRRAREFTLFVAFSAAGLVIENGTLYAATSGLGWQDPLRSNLVKALGITAATCFRFVTYRTWVFRRAGSPGPAPARAAYRARAPAARDPDQGALPHRADDAEREAERRQEMDAAKATQAADGAPDAAPVTQALILAGGRATRMRPYTDDMPKAMVPVADSPIVAYQLAWLARHGVTSVTISGGYQHEMIREYTGDGARFGMDIRYAIESEPLGRGGGLKFAAASLADADAPFFVLNGDVITTFPLADLSRYHSSRGGMVTVALTAYRSRWGVAELDDGDRIRGFVQSPELPYWINAGVYVFDPEVLGELPERGDHEERTFPQLARDGELFGYRLAGYWRGIDTVKDVQEATEEVPVSVGALPPAFRTARPRA
ncbi:sugar phosphate nucleotidyltransferase [Streptomyces axinellae]|uniref:sugar phosphate nucleotidyltransferase n=1 Tax=Streptomyces axinellae TaxID=552788 RepID=UPI0031DE6775